MSTLQKTIIYFGVLILIAVTVGSYLLQSISTSFIDVKESMTFEDCEAAGGVTSLLYPRNCQTIGGRIFVESPRDVKKDGDDSDALYPRTCVMRGCNNEYCMDEEAPLIDTSICIARPERVCYEKAKCDVQSDGQCGWEETRLFLDCLVQKKSLTRELPQSSPLVDKECEEWFDGCMVCNAENVGDNSACPGSHCSEELLKNATCRKF